MPREVISTPDAPEYPTYSQAVKVGNTIYVAGTTGFDVATGELAGPTIHEQTRQALLNCEAILRAGGAELSDAVMVHTLLLRPEDADGVVEVFDEFFPEVRPPRCVSKLGVDRPGILVSLAMVAVTDWSPGLTWPCGSPDREHATTGRHRRSRRRRSWPVTVPLRWRRATSAGRPSRWAWWTRWRWTSCRWCSGPASG